MQTSVEKNGPTAGGLYDPRNLQSKALERWERQKRVWDSVRDSLLRNTAAGASATGDRTVLAASSSSSALAGSARNFSEGSRYARQRAEDFGMIEGGVPRAALGTNDIWESQLRRNDDAESGTRLVQIGKAIYPYALYGIVKDPAALLPDNPAYTRTVPPPNGTPLDSAGEDSRAARATLMRTAIRANADKCCGRHGETATSAQDEADAEALQTLLEDGDSENTYYKQQLELYFPYIQQRFPHFMLPREYLQVDGSPAPRMTPEEMKAQLRAQAQAQEGGTENPTPVQYFPPPQSVHLRSSRPGTANTTHTTNAHGSYMGTPSQPGLNGEGRSTPEPYAARLLDPYNSNKNNNSISRDHGEAAAADGEDVDGLDRLRTVSPIMPGEDTDEVAAEDESATRTKGPVLTLSASELVFTGDVGTLLHSELRLTNTSTVTCYYSWEPVDPFGEGVEDRQLLAQLSTHSESPREGLDARGPTSSPDERPCSSGQMSNSTSQRGERAVIDEAAVELDDTMHALLLRPPASIRAFFRLSKPLNGVILPEETQSFPVSVRPPTAGLHTQTYELLTIPPLPERILLKLVVLATPSAPSMAGLARIVDERLSARVRSDEARRVVQTLTRDVETPYEAADLRRAIRRRELQMARATQRQAETHDRERVQWRRANDSVMDGLPYNRAVYAKLAALQANLASTLQALGQPLRSGDHPWDGSVVALMRDVHALRDAACRTVLYDGLQALLRAARVSHSEDESLEALLPRAAAAATALVVARSLPLANSEAALQQYTPETTAASLAGGGGGGGGGASGRRPGSTHKRAAGATAPGNAAATTTTGAGGKGGANAHSGAGSEWTAPVVGSLRDTLKAPAPTTRADEESLQSELEVLTALSEEEVRCGASAATAQYWRAFRDAIDAACDLPLLSVVESSRQESVKAIQHATLMETKTALEVVAPVAKATGRKK